MQRAAHAVAGLVEDGLQALASLRCAHHGAMVDRGPDTYATGVTRRPQPARTRTPITMAAMSATTLPDIVKALERRRRTAAETWNLGDEVVLIGAGVPVPVPGRGDRIYPFRAHSEYLYLTDRERPGGVLAFDPQTGWSDFVVPVSREETVWEGIDPDSV